MPTSGASWVVLGLAVVLLAAGLAFVNQPVAASACLPDDPFCAGPSFQAAGAQLVGWSFIGMGALFLVLGLGLLRGGPIGSMVRPPGRTR